MYNTYGTQEYRQQDIMGASPIRLVVMAYDLAINACEKRDFVRAIKAVSVLRDALNFDYYSQAAQLFAVYQWCLDCIREEDYESALRTLKDLRGAWLTVERRFSSATNAVPIEQTQDVQQAAMA